MPTDGEWGGTAQAVQVRGLLASGNAAQARQTAQRFLAARPGSYEALYLAGDTDLAAGQAAQALSRYQAASLVRFPDSLLLRISLAYERMGQAGNSRLLVTRYLAAMPQSPLAATAAGQSAFAHEWESARALLENLRRRGGNRDARLLSDLSFAQLRAADGDATSRSAAGPGPCRQLVRLPRRPMPWRWRPRAGMPFWRGNCWIRREAGAGNNPLLDETANKLGER